jgi:hypothetical protein
MISAFAAEERIRPAHPELSRARRNPPCLPPFDSWNQLTLSVPGPTRNRRVSAGKIAPLFSTSYELLSPQLPSFQKLLRCPLFFTSPARFSLSMLFSLQASKLKPRISNSLPPLLQFFAAFGPSVSFLLNSLQTLFRKTGGGGNENDPQIASLPG